MSFRPPPHGTFRACLVTLSARSKCRTVNVMLRTDSDTGERILFNGSRYFPDNLTVRARQITICWDNTESTYLVLFNDDLSRDIANGFKPEYHGFALVCRLANDNTNLHVSMRAKRDKWAALQAVMR